VGSGGESLSEVLPLVLVLSVALVFSVVLFAVKASVGDGAGLVCGPEECTKKVPAGGMCGTGYCALSGGKEWRGAMEEVNGMES